MGKICSVLVTKIKKVWTQAEKSEHISKEDIKVQMLHTDKDTWVAEVSGMHQQANNTDNLVQQWDFKSKTQAFYPGERWTRYSFSQNYVSFPGYMP